MSLDDNIRTRYLIDSEILTLMDLSDFKEDINKFDNKEGLDEDGPLFSLFVYATKLVERVNKDRVYFKEYFEPNFGGVKYYQNGRKVSDSVVNFATESLIWWGDILPTLSSIYDDSKNFTDFNNLIINQLQRGPILINRKDKNRSYVDNELKKIIHVLHTGQSCFKKNKNSDFINCKECEYEDSLVKERKEINKIKDPVEKETKLENAIYNAMRSVPYRLPNPNTKIRTPLYKTPDFIKIVIKACAIGFPQLNFDVFVKLFRKILRNFEKSEPINIEDQIIEDEDTEKKFSEIELEDFDFNKEIIEFNADDFSIILRIFGLEPFKTDQDLMKHFDKSARTISSMKNNMIEKLTNLVKTKVDNESWDEDSAEEFIHTLKRAAKDCFYKEEVMIVESK